MQRFREGFTAIPPMRTLGEIVGPRRCGRRARSPQARLRRSRPSCAALGVDFSFTPVLDLDYGTSGVIGDRAFHRNPNAVAHLAAAFTDGLAAGGMAGVGKHFPGHGFVAADSHDELPRRRPAPRADRGRRPGAVRRADPTRTRGDHAGARCSTGGRCAAGGLFARAWLRDILRDRLRLRRPRHLRRSRHGGGALREGDIVARADAALAAGCDRGARPATITRRPMTSSHAGRCNPSPDLARRLAWLEGRAPRPRL